VNRAVNTMAHLLVIESWITEMGHFVPQRIQRLGHRFTFVTRDLQHYLNSPHGGPAHPLLNAQKILERETNHEADLLDFLVEQHAIDPFDGVLTTCDYYLGTAARAAARLGLPGPPPAALDTARLKHRMRQALAEAGLPNPPFRIATSWPEARDAADALGYPLVFKPVDLSGGMFVTLVADEPALRAAFDRLATFPINNRRQVRPPEVLLEGYLDGPELSVDAVTLDGQTTVLGLTDKTLVGAPYFIEDSHMFPAPVDPDQVATTAALVRAALAAVGYTHGVSHTEVRLTADGPRIIEINVRPGGGHISELHELVLGISPVELLVQLALGEQPDLTPRSTGIASAAVQYVVPARGGTVTAITGHELFENEPDLRHWELKPVVGAMLRAPIDNSDCMGHVLYVDPSGLGARARAERAVAHLRFEFDDGESAPPLSPAAHAATAR
jgi:argininosuccinate lyase